MTDSFQSDKPDPQPKSQPPTNGSFWAELKRRKVTRVAITYAVVAWLLIQVTSIVFPQFDIPVWAGRLVTLLLAIAFPVALIITWAFELTPEGIKTTKTAREQRGGEPVSAGEQSKRNLRTVVFSAALPTLIFGALAVFFFFRSESSDSDLSTPPPSLSTDDLSIAVLPLTNMSPDEENAFFADGVHEDVLTTLSKVKAFRVMGRTSTLQFRDTTKTLKEIGQILGVRYLVEGSVRRAMGQVRVTVQLIDAQTQDHVWAENYDRPLDDIFAIQSEVAKAIAGELHAALSPEEIERIDKKLTENTTAYDLFIRVRQIEQRESREDYGNTFPFLETIVALDPNFELAWRKLCHRRIIEWSDRGKEDPELLEEAYEALENAERLKGGPQYLARAQFAELVEGDYEGALSLMRQSIESGEQNDFTDPQNGVRRFCVILGRLEEAQQYAEISLSNDPFSGRRKELLLNILHYRRLYDERRALMESMAEGMDLENESQWKWRLSQNEFLRSGNLGAYVEALNEIRQSTTERRYRNSIDRLIAMLSRDYHRMLEMTEGFRGVQRNVRSLLRLPDELVHSVLLLKTGDREQAASLVKEKRVSFEREINRYPKIAEPDDWSELAICAAWGKDHEAMVEAIQKSRELTATPRYKYPEQVECETHIAFAYLLMDEREKAIETLEAASEMEGPDRLSVMLQTMFQFDELRGDPRFDALLN